MESWHYVQQVVTIFLYLVMFQHLTEQLELDLSPLEYMMKCFPEIKEKEEMRKIIGRYGLTGKQQVGMWFSEWWIRDVGRCTVKWLKKSTALKETSKMCRRSVPSGTCLMVRSVGCVLPGWPGRTHTCCSWTNPPITWTSRRSTPWQKRSTSLMVAWCWLATTLG